MTFNPSPTKSEIDHLNKLIAQKQFGEALGFLEAMRDRLGIEQRKWLDERISEIKRTLNYNRYVDDYNRAVDFYNQRRFDDAIAVLEKLLATLPEGRESESARSLLNDALKTLN